MGRGEQRLRGRRRIASGREKRADAAEVAYLVHIEPSNEFYGWCEPGTYVVQRRFLARHARGMVVQVSKDGRWAKVLWGNFHCNFLEGDPWFSVEAQPLLQRYEEYAGEALPEVLRKYFERVGATTFV